MVDGNSTLGVATLTGTTLRAATPTLVAAIKGAVVVNALSFCKISCLE